MLVKVHEKVDGPGYHCHEIHLEYVAVDDPCNIVSIEDDGASGLEPISVFVGTITSGKDIAKSHDFNPCNIDCFPHRIFATVKISKLHIIKVKVDTRADTFVITVTDLHFPFPFDINAQQYSKWQRRCRIESTVECFLNVTFVTHWEFRDFSGFQVNWCLLWN